MAKTKFVNIDHGVTRIVFLIKNYAIKIPNFHYSWLNFIQGIVHNIQENKMWKSVNMGYNKECKLLLCPIVFCSFGGFILVMKRADVRRHEIEEIEYEKLGNAIDREVRYAKWIEAGFEGDDKPDNYGYFENRLVKVDYQ